MSKIDYFIILGLSNGKFGFVKIFFDPKARSLNHRLHRMHRF